VTCVITRKNGCPLCDRSAAGEYEALPRDFGGSQIYIGRVLTFAPLNPVTHGYLLVIPEVHVDDPLAWPGCAAVGIVIGTPRGWPDTGSSHHAT
jgi:hypothetical protein